MYWQRCMWWELYSALKNITSVKQKREHNTNADWQNYSNTLDNNNTLCWNIFYCKQTGNKSILRWTYQIYILTLRGRDRIPHDNFICFRDGNSWINRHNFLFYYFGVSYMYTDGLQKVYTTPKFRNLRMKYSSYVFYCLKEQLVNFQCIWEGRDLP